MVILGLGSNMGDRLAYLRQAYQALQHLPALTIQQVSPIYCSDAMLPENAADNWDMPYLNIALRCETTLPPLQLLQQLKQLEHGIGRKPLGRHWGPREIDIDILAYDDCILKSDVLEIPHKGLCERPFALWPFADIAPFWIYPLAGPYQGKTAAQIVEKWGSRFSKSAPFHTHQIAQRLTGPILVGILNITPDSFSDGAQFTSVAAAVTHAQAMITAGAEIIDIGAQATSPSAQRLSAEQEWQRLEPFLTALIALKKQLRLPPKISVDTFQEDVARRALLLGTDMINDVSGLDDVNLRELAASTHSDWVIMHHLKLPEERAHVLPRDQDPMTTVLEWGKARIAALIQAGIARERIIFDPGIGFGKMAEQSVALLKNLERLHELGTRLYVGHSRKSFLTLFTNEACQQRDLETATLCVLLAQKKVDYIRVHNVAMCTRVLNLTAQLI